jgi:hypothetical protein
MLNYTQKEHTTQYFTADVSLCCWINITALPYGSQVAVFYPNRGQYEIQQQARSRTESPQNTSSKIS